MDENPCIEFTNLHEGQFKIINKTDFIEAVSELSEGARNLDAKRVAGELDRHGNLKYHGKLVFQFAKWQQLLNQRVSYN